MNKRTKLTRIICFFLKDFASDEKRLERNMRKYLQEDMIAIAKLNAELKTIKNEKSK